MCLVIIVVVVIIVGIVNVIVAFNITINIFVTVIIPLSYCFPSQTQLVQHGIESQQWRIWQLDWPAQQVAFIIRPILFIIPSNVPF